MSLLSKAWHAARGTDDSSPEQRARKNRKALEEQGFEVPTLDGLQQAGATYTPLSPGPTMGGFESGPMPGMPGLGSGPIRTNFANLLGGMQSDYQSGPGLFGGVPSLGGDQNLTGWKPEQTGTTPVDDSTDWAKYLGLGLQGAGLLADVYGAHQQGKTVDKQLEYERKRDQEERERRIRAGKALRGSLAGYLAKGG